MGLTPASFGGLKTSPAETLEIINTVQADFEKMPEWTVESIDQELRAVADKLGKKLRVVTPPLFVAMSGSQRSLPLFDSMALLGRLRRAPAPEDCRNRGGLHGGCREEFHHSAPHPPVGTFSPPAGEGS